PSTHETFGSFTQSEVLMNRNRIVFIMLIPAMCFFFSTGYSQAQDGTIQASWDRAKTNVPYATPKQYQRQPSSEPASTPWGEGRSSDSRPWPALSVSSTPDEYFKANTAVIDSLARLYCLSSNYIGTLRIRNEQTMQGTEEPRARDFNYERDGKSTQHGSSVHGRQSVQRLHKELLHLLDRCLVGR
ncbi:MAG: hypothetical protein KFH87_14490, partial [Bacteroidetes bacterium]|nr:hypothetical protein [Bacteroidota bacterium]